MKRKPFLRLLAMLLTVCIVIGLFPTMSVTAYAANEDITLGSAVGTTAEYQFSGATVSSGIKVLNISVNSGNFTLTNATGFTNGVVSSTESHPTAYTGKKYVSVQFTATSGKTAQEALRSIKFKNDGRSQTVTVTGLVDGSITLQGKDILFNGHIYEVSSSRMTWANAMNWSLRMSTYSSVTHHQYPGFEPQPIAIETLLENQVLINLYNAGYRDMWLSAVPKGYDAGNIEYNADTNTVTVTGQPKASGLNSVNYHDDNAGACYRWLLQSESTLPKKSDEMGSCWHRQEPTGAGGPIWFGYGGAYWDDLQPVDWVNATHYAITEWVPSGSAASNSIITETAEITAASINSSVSTLAELNAAIEAVASGTTITLSGDIAGAVTIPADKNITIDLNGHTIDGGNTSNGSGIVNNGTLTLKDSSTSGAGTVKGNYGLTNNGTLTVESGTIEGTGKEGIKNNASATGLTVTGGTIKGADYAICDYDSNGTVRLSNCTLEHTDESGETTENGSGWVIGSWSTYNGGTYIIEEGVLMKNANGNKDGLIHTSATGTAAGNGQVSVSNYSDICFTEGENGYMVVTGAVTTAAELNEAIANGTNPIKLGANISGTVTIPEGKTVVLDLNGHTINGGGSNPGIINNGTLTVKDSGENGTVTGRYGIKNAGSLTVEGGTLIATGNDGIFNDTKATSLTVTGGTIMGNNLAICDYNSEGEVSLSGCTLECTGSGSGSGVGYVLGSYGSNKGGTYTISSDVVMVNNAHTANLINTSSDGTAAKGSQVAVEGYSNTYFASNGDGTYSLAKEVTTAKELNAALAEGVKEIKLGGNITGPITVPENYAGTIDLNGHKIEATGNEQIGIIVEKGAGLTVTDTSPDKNGTVTGNLYGIANEGTVTIKSGTVSGGRAGINIPSEATAGNGIVTVKGGTVQGTGYTSGNASGDTSGYGIINDNRNNGGVVLTVEGGTVTGTTAGIKIYDNGTKGDVSVTGGTVTATGTNSSGIDASDATSDVVISVSGGTITGTTHGINNKGTLNVSGGNITGGSDAGDVGINSTGTLNLTGTVKLQDDINGTVTVPAGATANLDLNGHEIKCEVDNNAGDQSNSGHAIDNSGTLTITNSSNAQGKITGSGHGIVNNPGQATTGVNAVLNVNGDSAGDILITGTVHQGITSYAGSDTNIDGATVKGGYYAICDMSGTPGNSVQNAYLERTGESAINTATGAGYVIGAYSSQNGGTWNIIDGVVMKNNEELAEGTQSTSDNLINTTEKNGIKLANNTNSTVDYGTANNDGSYTVTNVISVNNDTLSTVLAALPKDGTHVTIKLDGDISGEVEIPAGANVTLDLAGHSINVSGDAVVNKGTLTVKDSRGQNGEIGTINGTGTGGHGIYNEGVLTVENGTIIGGNDGIYNDDAATSITVTGGTITGGNYAICDDDANGKVTLSGCTLSATNDYVIGGYENKGGTYTIAEDVLLKNTNYPNNLINTSATGTAAATYQVAVNDYDRLYYVDETVKGEDGTEIKTGNKVVKYAVEVTTVDQLKAALEAGQHVQLAGDIDLGEAALEIAAGKDVAIDLNGHTLTYSGNGSAIANSGTLTVKDTSAKGNGTIKATSGVGIANSGNLTFESGNIESAENGIDNGSSGGNNTNVALTVTGGKITATGDNSYGIANWATATVSNATVTGGLTGIGNKGTLTVESGTVTGGTNGIDNGVSGVGSATVNGGTITGGTTGIKNTATGEGNGLVVNGGTITATGANGVGINNAGTLDVNGGTITATGKDSNSGTGTAINNSGTATIGGTGQTANITVTGTKGGVENTGSLTVAEVSGKTTAITGTGNDGILNSGSGTVTVSGGTVTGGKYAVCDQSDSTTNSATGGKFVVTGINENSVGDTTTGYVISGHNNKTGGTWEISTGVQFENQVAGNADKLVNTGANGTAGTDGVTLSNWENIEFSDADGNGVYTVVARSVDTKEELQLLLDNASKDPTNPTKITLNKDILGSITIPAGVYVELDLNGHSIKDTGANAITVTNNGTLVVKDTAANSKAEIYGTGVGINNTNNGKLTVESGAIRAGKDGIQQTANATGATVTVNGGKISGGNNAIYSPGTAGGTITGGYLKADGGSGGAVVHRISNAEGTSSWTIANNGKVQMEYTGKGTGATATTEGEKYYNNIIVTNSTELAFVEENGVATVWTKANSKETLTDLINSASTNPAKPTVIKLGVDIEGPITIPDGKYVTIDLNGHSINTTNTTGESGTVYNDSIINNGTLTVKDSAPKKDSSGNITNGIISQHVGIVNNGTLTVESGKISGIDGIQQQDTDAKVTVNGGTIIGSNGAIYDAVGTTGNEINGGYFESQSNGCAAVYTDNGKNSSWTIANDGSVTMKNTVNASNLLSGINVTNADNLNIVTDEDGVATVYAKVATAAELQDALNAGAAQIVLSKDITGPITVPVGYTGVIDLCGNTISNTEKGAGNYALINKGTLEIVDSGKAGEGEGANKTYGKITGYQGISNLGNLTLTGITVESSGLEAVQNGNGNASATLVINGGTITGQGYAIGDYSNSTTNKIEGNVTLTSIGNYPVLSSHGNSKGGTWEIANTVTLKTNNANPLNAVDSTANPGKSQVKVEDYNDLTLTSTPATETEPITYDVEYISNWTSVGTLADLEAALTYNATTNTNAVIKLTGDIQLDDTINIPAEMKARIDLNGHTITAADGKNAFVNNGTLIIQDNSTAGTGAITSTDANTSTGDAITNNGTMTVAGGSITGKKHGINNNGTLNVTGGSITGTEFDGIVNGSTNYTGATVNMSGGTVTGGAFAIYDQSTSTGNVISGGTLVSTGKQTWGTPLGSSTTDTKTGGTWDIATDGSVVMKDNEDKLVEVKGVGGNAGGITLAGNKELKYVGPDSEGFHTVYGIAKVNTVDELKAAIEAGKTDIKLTGNITLTDTLDIPAGAKVNLDLNGHTLTYTGTGSAITNSGNLTVKDTVGTGKIEATGAIGINNISGGTLTVESGTISGATNGINNSGTATVNGGTISSTSNNGVGIANSGTATIGGNGQTDDISVSGVIGISNLGTLTLGEDTGKTTTITGNGTDGICNLSGATGPVTINGGTVKGGQYAICDYNESGTGNTVSGGTLERTNSTTTGYVLGSYNDKGGSWTVSEDVVMKNTEDGKWICTGVSGNADADGQVTIANFEDITVAGEASESGYTATVENTGVDTAGKLAAAINSAVAGETITLTGDIEGPITIPAGKNIVLDLHGYKITSSTSGINNNGTLTVKDSNPNSASGIVATKIGINNAGTLTVESGKIVGTNHEGISNLSGATKVTVNGGTISGGNFAICDYDSDGENEVNGGTLIRTKSGNGYVIGSYGSGQGGTWDIADDGSVTMKNTVSGKWVNTPLDGTADSAPQVSVEDYGEITFDTTAAGKTYTAVVKATDATTETKVAVVNGDLSFTNMPATGAENPATVEFFAAPSGIASLTAQTAPATGAVSLTSTEVTAAAGSIDLAALSGVDNTDKLGGETPVLWVKVTSKDAEGNAVEQWFCVGEYESWDEAASSDNTAAKADAVTDSINDMLDLPTDKNNPLSATALNSQISTIKNAVKDSTDETEIAKAEAKLDVIKSAAEKANAINGNSALSETEKTELLNAVADAMNKALTAIDGTTDDAAIEEAEAKADAKIEAIAKAADTLTAIDGLSNLSADKKADIKEDITEVLDDAIGIIDGGEDGTAPVTVAEAELTAAKAEAKMQAELAAAESIDEIMGSYYLSGSETKGDKKALIEKINTAKNAANTAIGNAETESAVTLAAEKLNAKAEVVSEAFSAYTMLNTMSEIENADTFKEKVLAEIDTAFDDIDDETVLAGVNTAKLRGVSAIEDIVVEAAVADLTAAKKAADKAIDKALEAEKAAIEALENLSTEEKASLKSAADAAAAAAKTAIASASTVPAVSDARTNGRNAIELAGDKAEAIAAVNKTAAQKKALADNLTSLNDNARNELKAEIAKAADDAKATIMNASSPEAIENAKSSAASSISSSVNTAITENFKAAKGDAIDAINAAVVDKNNEIEKMNLSEEAEAALKAAIKAEADEAITAVNSAANTSAALKAKNDAIADMNVIYAGAVAESNLTAGKAAAIEALTAAAEAKKAEIDILTNLTEEEKDIYKSSIDDAVTAAKAAVTAAADAENVNAMIEALTNGINNIKARVDSAVAEDLANGQSSAKENLSSTANKATTAIEVMGNLTAEEKADLKAMIEAAEAKAEAEIAEAETPEAVAAAEEAAASALEVIAAKAEAMDRVSELASEKKAAIEKTLGLTAERKEALKAVVDEQVNAAKADIMDAETKADVLKLKGEFANAYEIGIAYRIIRGAGQTVTKGRYAIFTSDADFSKFIKVQVDGRDLDPANYTAVSGSTKITLNGSYTANLSYGRHTLTIVSVDGEANTYFSIVRFSAHGGDNKDEKPDNESNPSTGAFAPEE